MAAGAAASKGAVFLIAALFAAPAIEFARATNGVPLASWNRSAFIGWGLLAVIGLWAHGFWLAGDVLHDRVKRGLLPPD